MKEFALEELSQFDGKEGRPAYIVHQGRVFDVSESKLWKGGLHMRRHHAGKDLSVDIKAAPHETDVLERYPQVGIVKKAVEGAPTEGKETLSAVLRLINRYPMLRRHPHPMTVHFPIVFMFSTTLFNLLYLITGNKSFEISALYCLGTGVVFIPIVILTGLFSWWINYLAKPIRPVEFKIIFSIALFLVALIAYAWRVAVPDIMDSSGPASIVYFVLILSLLPIVSVIGWFGAQLTFPMEEPS